MYFPNNVKIFNVEQRSDEWRFLRACKTPVKGKFPSDWIPFITPFRFTASEIYTLTGKGQYKTRSQYIGEVSGKLERKFSGNVHTSRGQRLEPSVRQRYEREHNVNVVEIGFLVPKWCPFIGVSPDGVMQEGCIEIKCPVSIWPELKNEGMIKPEHYAQMQMTMEICDRDWCDYLVYSEKDNEYLELRVKRDKKYWDDFLYPCILSAIKEVKDIIVNDIVHDLELTD